MTHATRDEALESLERARADYLIRARAAAEMLARIAEAVTVDDVRRLCPPPAEIDGRVMGAIFAGAEWEPVAFVNSNRSTCHKRPIRQFRKVGQ